MRWRRFVAVGDSFTEGLDDPYPDGSGFRGWADLVATTLAHRCRGEPGESFRYANLAVRGRLFGAIVDQQVGPALALGPDLVSFAGGGNDVLRPSFDAQAMRDRFDEVVATIRATGADVLVFRWVDMARRLPGGRLIRPRTALLNEAVDEVAQRHAAVMVDLWRDDEFGHDHLWSDDRLHLSPAGHRRVAAHVLEALGMKADPSWLDPAAPVEPPPWLVARVRDAQWAGRHLAPWIRRRITGRSSGDTVTAKRPSLGPPPDLIDSGG